MAIGKLSNTTFYNSERELSPNYALYQGKTKHSQKQAFADVLFKIGVLENFVIFTGKHLCSSLFLIKL